MVWFWLDVKEMNGQPGPSLHSKCLDMTSLVVLCEYLCSLWFAQPEGKADMLTTCKYPLACRAMLVALHNQGFTPWRSTLDIFRAT